MNIVKEFKCYKGNSKELKEEDFLGRCLVLDCTNSSDYQYLVESLIIGRNTTKNPFDINTSIYSESREVSLETIPELLINKSYLVSDLNLEGKSLYVGIHFINNELEYYALRVPEFTSRIVSPFFDEIIKDSNGNPVVLSSSSYLLIMNSKGKELSEIQIKSLTDRSYLIATKKNELTEETFMSNGSKFLESTPNYKLIKPKDILSSPIDKNPVNGKIKNISIREESWNDFSIGWKKGDKVLYKNISYICIAPSTNDNNFNNSKIWRRT